MKCANHPNAPAIENCENCATALCGMCANFSEFGVLCEKCVEIRETERTVAVEAARHEQPDEPAIVETPEEEMAAGPAHKERNPAVLQVTVIAICAVIVIARSTVFAPQQTAVDPQLQALEFSLIALAECMVTFQQIGESLAAGERPDPTLRCADSPQPNRVIESGDNLIVEHPQPEYYGYSSLSVSRRNPAPVLGPPLPQT